MLAVGTLPPVGVEQPRVQSGPVAKPFLRHPNAVIMALPQELWVRERPMDPP